MAIPIQQELSSVYTSNSVPTQEQRYASLTDAFEVIYSAKPSYIARAPGRVNALGEHIDYSGFDVLPMAIEKDVLIACLASPAEEASRFELHNVDPKYSEHEFSISALDAEQVQIDDSKLQWENYFKAGCKGMLAYLKPEHAAQPVHLRMLFTGSVPAGGGLSSSAAMCVASCIAVGQGLGVLDKFTKEELTQIAIDSERAVGVQSGGMDQSASVLSTRGSLLHISFFPKLHATPVPLPSGSSQPCFVIANSMVVSNKQVTSKIHYNLRVVECRVAAYLLAQMLNVSTEHSATLKQVIDQHFSSSPDASVAEHMQRLVIILKSLEQVLEEYKDGMEWSEVYKLCGVEDGKVFKQKFHPNFEIVASKLQIYKRAQHVLEEAARVYEARQLLEQASTDAPKQLGELMQLSHTSCRDLYECSCDELNRLVALAMEAGSLGARLTGAGWGGSSVSLFDSREKGEAFVQSLRTTYYSEVSDEDYHTAAFMTEPESGACVVVL